jgi:hypothetical protein
MRRYNKISNLAVIYRCWVCRISIYPTCKAFFGPGIALKCITCGPWQPQELIQAQDTFQALIVRLGGAAATEHRV